MGHFHKWNTRIPVCLFDMILCGLIGDGYDNGLVPNEWLTAIYFKDGPLLGCTLSCVFSVYPFPLWWLSKCTLCLIIITKSEVWTVIHCLGLGHETMVFAVCLSIFLCVSRSRRVNRSRPRQYGCHFADNIFRLIFLNDIFILIQIASKLIPN